MVPLRDTPRRYAHGARHLPVRPVPPNQGGGRQVRRRCWPDARPGAGQRRGVPEWHTAETAARGQLPAGSSREGSLARPGLRARIAPGRPQPHPQLPMRHQPQAARSAGLSWPASQAGRDQRCHDREACQHGAARGADGGARGAVFRGASRGIAPHPRARLLQPRRLQCGQRPAAGRVLAQWAVGDLGTCRAGTLPRHIPCTYPSDKTPSAKALSAAPPARACSAAALLPANSYAAFDVARPPPPPPVPFRRVLSST